MYELPSTVVFTSSSWAVLDEFRLNALTVGHLYSKGDSVFVKTVLEGERFAVSKP